MVKPTENSAHPSAIHIGLFEGIGGFSLAARKAGWETMVTCEIEPLCQRVLKYHFQDAYHHGDIKTLNYGTINAELSERYGHDWRNRPIVLTGGFPCQPYSLAGKRKGKEDDRHLWPEMLRVIQELQPEWVVGENVYGIVSWNGGLVFEEVQADLEAQGYEVWPVILPAASVGAPHKRDRVWFIAHSYRHGYGRNDRSFKTGTEERKGEGDKEERQWIRSDFGGAKSEGSASNATKQRLPVSGFAGKSEFQEENREGVDNRPEFICDAPNAYSFIRCERGLYQEGSEEAKRHIGALDSWDSGRTWENFPTQPPVCGRNDGFPGELDGITLPKWRNSTIKAFGNAIVPQVAYELFKVINTLENDQTTRSTTRLHSIP
ncbi:DNA (cytosine-5-)-methyltransferase [Leadbetterella byssophila]|uniref:DNA (cytosine-5-)-methyltransferase n=1 Tax=Leadbetterella byssophila TaxID=316068 RepID=UPI00399EFB1F